jgi:hypothetical protein
MTLKENKKITLALIEEYTKGNEKLTDDTDIQDRINLLYAPAYQELSQYKKIVRTKVLKEIGDATDEEGYEEMSMPANMYQYKKIVAWDSKGKEVTPDYKILGKKIYIKRDSNYQYILEYYINPTQITENTSDDFVLEIDQDVQNILPYQVANDILKVDPSADYSAFEREYQRKRELLDGSINSNPTVVIEEGII